MPFLERKVTRAGERERLVCSRCDLVVYDNPKIVVGSVIAHGDNLLLCQRAIQPAAGLWTVPAGYLEIGEDLEQGARREAFEEAGMEIETEGLLAIYSGAEEKHVQIFFRARPVFRSHVPGAETLALRFFHWEEIPWSSLAFPAVDAVLKIWHRTRDHPLPCVTFPLGD